MRQRPPVFVQTNEISVVIQVHSLVLGAQAEHNACSVYLVENGHLPIVVVAVLRKCFGASYGGRALAAFRMKTNVQFIIAQDTLNYYKILIKCGISIN